MLVFRGIALLDVHWTEKLGTANQGSGVSKEKQRLMSLGRPRL